MRLHRIIVGAAPALGHRPLDVLAGVLDVAGLAVQAVLRVYLQPRPAVRVLVVLVHAWSGGGVFVEGGVGGGRGSCCCNGWPRPVHRQ